MQNKRNLKFLDIPIMRDIGKYSEKCRFDTFGEQKPISYAELSEIMNKQIEKEMLNAMDECFSYTTPTNQTTTGFDTEAFKKLVNSIRKPPKVFLSWYIEDEYQIFYIEAKNDFEQDVYTMHPKGAKKLLIMYPTLIHYIQNPELIEE